MVLKITTSFIILFAFCLIMFSCMKFVAGMQAMVATVAFRNKEISTALTYANRAKTYNPMEREHHLYLNEVIAKYRELKKQMRKKR